MEVKERDFGYREIVWSPEREEVQVRGRDCYDRVTVRAQVQRW